MYRFRQFAKNDQHPPTYLTLTIPSRSIILHSHALFGKIWPNNRLAHPCLGLALPLENPEFAANLSVNVWPFFVLIGFFVLNPILSDLAILC